MTQPRAVIGGTGHSGSGYIAAVLGMCGLRAGHEGYFNPLSFKKLDLDVDSSWLAVNHLDTFDGIIWHQVREPIATIESIYKTADWERIYWQERKKALSVVTGDRLIDSVITYVDINMQFEAYAKKRWKVEEVDADLVQSLCADLGHKISTAEADLALNRVDEKYNLHVRDHTWTYFDLPAHESTMQLWRMVYRYGYHTDEVLGDFDDQP